MNSTYGMPKLEAKIMENLEVAYNALRMAGEDMDVVDTVKAVKIIDVRKAVLALLQGELNI